MDEKHLENTKRIAKNTLMLYVRMLFSMLVSLYTSRVVLNTLGVEDFGIYNVVGGIASMMTFLSVSMSGATSRFFAFELGTKNIKGLSEAFSSSMIMYLGLSLIVLIIAETLGLWFLETKLVIPEERMSVARIVYQVSVFSTIIGFTQVPYDASIIAHEKMGVYAYIGILATILRLVVAFLITLGGFDKLLLYAVLSFVTSIIVMSIYRGYCLYHFSEVHFYFKLNKNILKPMLTFSAYDLYGNASVMMRTQGVNMLLNMFFGPIVNAAAAVATQVQNAVMSFAGNVITSVRPQIIKYYATGEYDTMLYLVNSSAKFTCLLLTIISIPVMIEIDFILKLWLGNIPDWTPIFCFYVLLFNFFVNMSQILVTAIHATGNIKRPSFINGTLYLLVVPLSYMAFKLGQDAWISYLLNVLAVILGVLSNAWTINLYLGRNFFKNFICETLLKCILVFLMTYIVAYIVHDIMSYGFMRVLAVFAVVCLATVFLGFSVVLTTAERKWVINQIKSKVCRKI